MCRVYLDPTEPTFLGLLIMISLMKKSFVTRKDDDDDNYSGQAFVQVRGKAALHPITCKQSLKSLILLPAECHGP